MSRMPPAPHGARGATRTTLLMLLGAILAGALLARFVYLPLTWQIRDRRAMVEVLRLKLADAQVAIARLPQSTAERQRLEAQYRALTGRMTRGESLVRILERLSQQAKAHRVGMAVVKSHADDAASRMLTLGSMVTLHETPLALQLTGRYRPIAEFLGGLAEAPLLSTVRTVTITKPDAANATVRADVTLAVYVAEARAQP